jgi:hypothetical protein
MSEKDLWRLLLGILCIVSLYISFDTIRMLPPSKEGNGNIGWGLLGLFVASCCIMVALSI